LGGYFKLNLPAESPSPPPTTFSRVSIHYIIIILYLCPIYRQAHRSCSCSQRSELIEFSCFFPPPTPLGDEWSHNTPTAIQKQRTSEGEKNEFKSKKKNLKKTIKRPLLFHVFRLRRILISTIVMII